MSGSYYSDESDHDSHRAASGGDPYAAAAAASPPIPAPLSNGDDSGGPNSQRYVFSSQTTRDTAWVDDPTADEFRTEYNSLMVSPRNAATTISAGPLPPGAAKALASAGGGTRNGFSSSGHPAVDVASCCVRVLRWLSVYDWFLVAAIGFAIAIAVALSVYSSDDHAFQSMVNDDCGARARTISQAAENVIDTTRALVAFVSHAPLCSRVDFAHYSSVFGVGSRQGIIISYQERVKPQQRAEWERSMSADFNRTVTIHELPNANDVLVRPEETKRRARTGGELPAEDYYPVKLAYPHTATADLYIGADFASLPGQALLMKQSLTRRAELASFSCAPQPVLGFHWLSHYIPVFNASLPTATTEQRRTAVLGVMGSTVNVSSFLAHALASVYRPLQMHIVVSDIEDDPTAPHNINNTALNSIATGTNRTHSGASYRLYDSWYDDMDSGHIHPPPTSFSPRAEIDSGSTALVDTARSQTVEFKHLGRRWVMKCEPLKSLSRGLILMPLVLLISISIVGLLLSLLWRRYALLKALLLAVERANLAKTSFLSFICHELRNPLQYEPKRCCLR